MKLDKETQDKLQNLQLVEQNLQGFLLQKQAFQLELNETESVLEEVKKSDDEVYKILGQVMLKADKGKIMKEMQERKETMALRLKAIEKQEKILREKIEKIRKELEEKLK